MTPAFHVYGSVCDHLASINVVLQANIIGCVDVIYLRVSDTLDHDITVGGDLFKGIADGP